MNVAVATILDRMDLLDEISHNKQLVILGHPGTGKTVFLKYLVTICANGRSDDTLGLPDLGAIGYLPIYVALSEFAAESLRNRGNYSLLDHLYAANRSHLLVNMPLGFFENALIQARCLVCLDGMDEVTDLSTREHVLEAIDALTSRFPGNYYIVTSRIVGYEGVALSDQQFVHYSLTSFDDADIKEFAEKWYRLREPDAEVASQQAINLVQAIEGNPNVKELAANPLLLTIMALIHKVEAELPGDRVHLYDKCTEALLNTWDQLKNIEQSQAIANLFRYRRSLLERLSYELLVRNEGSKPSRSINRAVLETLIARFLIEDIDPELDKMPQIAIEEAKNFLRSIQQRTGILVELGPDEFSFAHPTFGEYLAACYIHHNRIIFRGVDGLWDEIKGLLGHPEMQEVILLLLGRLNDYPSLPTQLIRRILDAQRTDPIEDALNRYLWLASRALYDHISISPVVRTEIIDRLLDLVAGTPIQLNLTSRRATGAMLMGIGASGVAADSLMAIQRLAQVDSSLAARLADLVCNTSLAIENRIFAAWVQGTLGLKDCAGAMLSAVAQDTGQQDWLRTVCTFALLEIECIDQCMEGIKSGSLMDSGFENIMLRHVRDNCGVSGLQLLIDLAGNSSVPVPLRAHAMRIVGARHKFLDKGISADTEVDPEWVEELVKILSEPDLDYQGFSAISDDLLRTGHYHKIVPTLMKRSKDLGASVELRFESAKLLLFGGYDSTASEALWMILNDEFNSFQQRINAADYLVRMRSMEGIRELVEAMISEAQCDSIPVFIHFSELLTKLDLAGVASDKFYALSSECKEEEELIRCINGMEKLGRNDIVEKALLEYISSSAIDLKLRMLSAWLILITEGLNNHQDRVRELLSSSQVVDQFSAQVQRVVGEYIR